MEAKFVIVQNGNNSETYLRMGIVDLHKHLIAENEVCRGGGKFEIDGNSKTIFLFGKSIDYGYPKFEHLKYVSEDWEDYDIVYSQSLFDKNNATPISDLSNEEITYTDML